MKKPNSLKQTPWHIALISGTVLILELAFIRLIPAEIKAISYFTNLILIAAFFGLGTGCILQKKTSLNWLMPLGLLLVFSFILVGRGIVIYEEAMQVHYWLQHSDVKGQALKLPLFQAAAMIFISASLPFVALGQTLARSMELFPRLVAYGWDIGGSLLGTLLFVLSSLLSLPPWIWPPLLMFVWSIFFVQSRLEKLVCPLVGIVFLFLANSPYQSMWSPYYYIQYKVQADGIPVWVNSSFHQFAIDFRSTDSKYRELQKTAYEKWDRPYKWYRNLHGGNGPEKVLVLGAGTGNDVNMALFNGVQEIVAIEIDPAILSLGEKYNSNKPYSHKNVRAYVDDARHFLQTSKEKFDMIVFGTLDSQSLLSGQANLRLENYIYTTEALEDTKNLLNDGGMVVIYYSVFKPWLWNRLYATARTVFGDHSRIEFEKSQILFNTLIVGTKGIEDFRDSQQHVERFGTGIPSTDDWPFIYLEYPTVAPIYQKLFALVLALIIGVFFLLRRIHRIRGLHANYLFLGLGFTLMESSAIVRLALIFGSTWVVNAVVFSSVLLTIFLANFMVFKKKAPSIRVAWVGLSLFILLNYFLPIPALFEVGITLRVILCGLLIGIPVFFAGVCFSSIFEKEPVTGYPLGINLIGAMAGGMIEYTSMLGGMRMVWLIILIIYLSAWLSTNLICKRAA